uniref:hypothetical protein n=1 Tax=Rhodococcus oryzae TaxID=2571143 RepID=UPI001FEC8BB1|nr:hypothetical protein [Rhodococcus oryzae]
MVIVFGAGFLTLISSVIWPGQALYLAPLFCEQPTGEAVVVSDTYASGDGTSTDFTLYCVGDRGQTIDAGWLRPFLLLWGCYAAALATVVVVVAVFSRKTATPEQHSL